MGLVSLGGVGSSEYVFIEGVLGNVRLRRRIMGKACSSLGEEGCN